jgi:hypothetical protein
MSEFTIADYPSTIGRPWTLAETEGRLFDNLLDLLAGGSGGGSPEGAQYHPDRKPSSGLVASCSDEFLDGFEATWRWANQGGATDVAELDSALLSTVGAGSANLRVRWVDGPAVATDFTVTAKLSPSWNCVTGGASSARLAGLILLVAGTESTPTALRTLSIRENGTGVANVRHGSTANYTTAPSSVAEIATASALVLYQPVYLQFRYTSSTLTLASYVSRDGLTWIPVGSETLSAEPNAWSIGRFVNSSEASGTPTTARFLWFRTGTNAAFLAGEVGS